MPGIKNTPIAESVGMILLRRAAFDDDALVDGCCPRCHSTDIDTEHDYSRWCNECAMYILKDDPTRFKDSPLPRLILASHLADALTSYDFPEREVKPRELAALVDHAAYLHMQVRELTETLRAERDRFRLASELRKPAGRAIPEGEVAA
jgi:hypothetical protein